MAYCTYSDVQSEFKSVTFSASTAVTDTEVTGFITQADAIIDGYIGSRYEAPVTAGTSALALLKWISIQIVRERVIKILASKTGVNEPDQLEETPMWKDMLEQIQKGSMNLVGATLLNAGGVKSGNVENDIEQVFDVTTQQW